MAKNIVYVDLIIDDKGTTKRIAVDQDKLSKSIEKTNKSAKETDRNMRGASQMSSNATKNFSKMQQGMSGIVGVYATIAAQIFAVSAAFQFLKSASQMTNLIAGQEALGAVSGVAYKTITQGLIAATDGQLQYAEAAQAAAIGTAAGLDPTQLTRLAKAAKNVSNALGRDLTDSFNRLIKGTTKAEPELLDELGIVLRLEPAMKEYALSIGKTAQDLSQFEKSQAIVNNVLTQAEEKFGAIEALMDPAGASLNKFIASFDDLMNSFKTGVIGIMGPVFDFLSKNTFALVGVLMAFAAPILKSILPNFAAMQAGVVASLGVQKIAHDKYQLEINETEIAIKKLGQTEAQMRRGAINQVKSAGTAAAKGGGTKLTASKKGGTGADFLLGVDDSKKAQANAKRILKHAQSNYDEHGKVISGKLKGYNRQQVAELQSSYDRRMLIMDKVALREEQNLKKSSLGWKLWGTKVKMVMNSVKTAAIKISGAMASGMNKAMAAAGWVGMLMMVYDMGKQAYNALNPLSEEEAKLAQSTEDFISSMETLNEEVARFADIRINPELSLGLSDLTAQTARASISSNVLNKTLEFVAIKQNEASDTWKTAKGELQKLLNSLTQISPAYEKFKKELDETGTITEESRKELAALQATFASLNTALTSLPQTMKNVKSALADLAGTAAKNPYRDMVNQMKKARDQSQEILAGKRTESQANTTQQFQLQKEEIEGSNKLRELETRRFALKTKIDEASKKSGKDRSNRLIKDGELDNIALQLLDAQVAEQKKSVKLTRDTLVIKRQQAALFPKEIDAADRLARNQQIQYDTFDKQMGKQTKIQKKINGLQTSYNEGQTAGITFKNKEANINNQLFQDQKKAEEAGKKLLTATTARMAVLDKGTAYDSDEARQAAIGDANEIVALAEVEVATVTKVNKLNKEKRAEQLEELARAKELFRVQTNQKLLSVRKELEEIAKRALKYEKERITLLEKQLKIQNEMAERAYKKTNRFAFVDEDKRKAEAAYQLESSLFIARTLAVEAEYAMKKEMIEMEYALIKVKLGSSRAEMNSILEAGTDTSAAQKRAAKDNLDLITKTEGLLAGLESKALANAASGEDLALLELINNLEKLKEAKDELSDMRKISDGLAQSLKSGMEDAFEGIITGTMNAKEAFLSMAQGVLKALGRMISEMLVAKLLASSLFSWMNPTAAATSGTFNASSMPVLTGGSGSIAGTLQPGIIPKPRYGGVFSEGKKVPGYGVGGIARGTQAGYPALLHGTEAVVPLPNGNSIPVELSRENAINNISVNVNVDNQGRGETEVSGKRQGADLGRALARAVKEEMQKQKRPGGILSPYGAA